MTAEELSEIVDKYGGETVKNEEAYGKVKDIDVLLTELEAEYGHIEVPEMYLTVNEIL